MKANIEKQVSVLHEELRSNNGVIPKEWVKWLPLIILFLRIAKIFTNDKVDKVIDEILLAISLYNAENQ